MSYQLIGASHLILGLKIAIFHEINLHKLLLPRLSIYIPMDTHFWVFLFDWCVAYNDFKPKIIYSFDIIIYRTIIANPSKGGDAKLQGLMWMFY